MTSIAYLLAKIGPDEGENEQHLISIVLRNRVRRFASGFASVTISLLEPRDHGRGNRLRDGPRGAARGRVERFGRRGTEPFEPFEPFEFIQNRNFH